MLLKPNLGGSFGNMGIKFPHNKERYEARLEVLRFLAQNWYRFCFEEVSTSETDVPGWDNLSDSDYSNLCKTLEWLWINRDIRRSYTLDDLITELDFSFNPEDLKDIKIIYQLKFHKWSDIKKRRVIKT